MASPMPRLAPVTSATRPPRSKDTVMTGLPVAGSAGADAALRGRVLFDHARDHLAGRPHVVDVADALAAAPDVAPGLLFHVAARAEVHLGLVGLGQVVRVEARRGHA